MQSQQRVGDPTEAPESMSSNGKSDFHPPSIDAGVQRLLDRQRQTRAAEDVIRARLDALIEEVRISHPEQIDRLPSILEGAASLLSAELEAKRRKARNGK